MTSVFIQKNNLKTELFYSLKYESVKCLLNIYNTVSENMVGNTLNFCFEHRLFIIKMHIMLNFKINSKV